MLNSLIVCYSAILSLVLADARTQITGSDNNILLLDTGNNLTALELPPNSNLSVGDNKILSIVVNPIIHNVAQGFGPNGSVGSNPAETTTLTPVTTTTPPDNLLVSSISLFFRKIKFFASFITNGVAGLVRGIIRFIICTFIPICGLFSVFGDEVVEESLVTPEGVVRGLDFLEAIIEKYHSVENFTIS